MINLKILCLLLVGVVIPSVLCCSGERKPLTVEQQHMVSKLAEKYAIAEDKITFDSLGRERAFSDVCAHQKSELKKSLSGNLTVLGLGQYSGRKILKAMDEEGHLLSITVVYDQLNIKEDDV